MWKVTVEPTCLEKGSKERVCTACDYSYEKVEIDALGHEYTSSVTTKATCEKDGVLTYKCTRTGCGDTYTEVIPATGHKYDKGVVTKEATCEEDGVKTFTCTNADCDEEYTEAIPAIGHKYDKGVVTKEATCTVNGEERADCSRCDYYETKELIANNHKDENLDGTCDYCNEYIADKDCLCVCHAKTIGAFVYKLFKIIDKVLKTNLVEKVFGISNLCDCGIRH